MTREDEEEDAEMIGEAPPTLLPSAGGWLLTELSSNIPERFVPPGREAKVGYGSQQRGHPLALGEPSCLTTVSQLQDPLALVSAAHVPPAENITIWLSVQLPP